MYIRCCVAKFSWLIGNITIINKYTITVVSDKKILSWSSFLVSLNAFQNFSSNSIIFVMKNVIDANVNHKIDVIIPKIFHEISSFKEFHHKIQLIRINNADNSMHVAIGQVHSKNFLSIEYLFKN